MKQLVVIPTYNECENIEAIIEAVLAVDSSIEILVVDDSSPDGTGAIVHKLMSSQERLHLLTRHKKEGLGRAYIAGFSWGLKNGFDVLVEMDADFSHRPSDLVNILKAIRGHDFVVGSRYVDGGSTVNWGFGRKLISRAGSLYARIILGFPMRDWTGGFNAWTKKALDIIQLDKVTSEGYSFQIELKYRALKGGLKGIEVPIIFEDRRVGQSKMSFRIVLEAFLRVWVMRFA